MNELVSREPGSWLCDYPRAYCTKCGEEIVWMKTKKGKAIPLNLGWVRRVSESAGLGLLLYRPSTEEHGVVVVSAGRYDKAGGYSCHLATCKGDES